MGRAKPARFATSGSTWSGLRSPLRRKSSADWARVSRSQTISGGRSGSAGSGALDHVAFDAVGLAETEARLTDKAVSYRRRTVPGVGLVQLFVEDPNGVSIELTFSAAEAESGHG